MDNVKGEGQLGVERGLMSSGFLGSYPPMPWFFIFILPGSGVWRVPPRILRIGSAAVAAVAAIPRMPTLHVLVQVLLVPVVTLSRRNWLLLLLVLLQVKLAGNLPVLHSAERRH